MLWSEQAEERMRAHVLLLLDYGPIELSDNTVVGIPNEEVGEVVVAMFRQCGCDVEWDGHPSSRIQAIFTKRN